MNLITFDKDVSIIFKKSSGNYPVTFQQGVPYVLGRAQYQRIAATDEAKHILKNSDIDARVPNFSVTSVGHPKKKLLFYSGCGGYGDQIMMWPVANLLSRLGFEVTVANDPGNQVCWYNFPWVMGLEVFPMTLERWESYDHHCIFDHLTNFDEHPGQMHPTDTALRKIGILPESVDPILKLIQPVLSPDEEAKAVEMCQGSKVGIYQLASSNQIRNFTPEKSAFLLGCLARKYPYLKWIATYDEWVSKDYAQAANDLNLPNVSPTVFRNLRDVWSITSRASIVVAPDSLMSHLAGVMRVPCVVYYGPTLPELRSKYYPTHKPIFLSSKCPHAGCSHSGVVFPRYCPDKPNRKMCELLEWIEPSHLTSQINALISEGFTV